MSRTRTQASAVRRTVEAIEELPDAPESLSPEAASFWREALASVPAGHFGRPDHALLAVWCEARVHLSAASERLAQDAGDPSALNAYVKLASAVTNVTAKLRLCPSSRNPRKDVTAGVVYERGGDAPGRYQPSEGAKKPKSKYGKYGGPAGDGYLGGG